MSTAAFSNLGNCGLGITGGIKTCGDRRDLAARDRPGKRKGPCASNQKGIQERNISRRPRRYGPGGALEILEYDSEQEAQSVTS